MFSTFISTRSSSSIKRGFATQGEKFPSFNLPHSYLGYIYLLYQPTMKFQALHPVGISVAQGIAAGPTSLLWAPFPRNASGQAKKSPTYKRSSSLNRFEARFCTTQCRVGKGTGQVKRKVELHHLSSYMYHNLHHFVLKSRQGCTRTLQKRQVRSLCAGSLSYSKLFI